MRLAWHEILTARLFKRRFLFAGRVATAEKFPGGV
jgi:hypothetical protein